MRILAISLFLVPFLACLAEAANETPLELAVDDYADGIDRPLLIAPASGGILGVFNAQVHLWAPTLDGTITAESGERLDTKNDLGIDDTELTIMPQFQLTVLGIGLRFDAYLLDYHGESTITRTFTFAGIPFNVSEDTTTDLSLDQYRLMIMIPLIDTSTVALSLQVGVAGLFLEGTITGDTAGTATDSAEIPIPLVGAVLHAHLGPVLLEVDVLGMTIDYADVSGTLLDLRISVGITVLKVAAVHAGFRYVHAEGETTDFAVDLTLQGFFVGVSVQF